ncbi:MAG: Na/Pi cotransporter family protein [Saprospiraceae bacterium]|uniref:Na/Pi cotransporter family protein n=1 Tax=Candidatus Opimibacter skivensis TaxID=2982028 RepID=A0A9D7SSN4_9BACT|nr:Na/Pi cotransporter family protein [Candidatus Opimibacter skivensis]
MVEFGWYGILQVLGALALFIYGMKVMSEGVQRMASIQLREALQRVTQNRISSFLTGFFTTAMIQSSSAATVMTVSFVNAGIISLTAAASIIIGANVGTTVTIWIVTILGFELNLFTLCLPLIALAMPFLFWKNGKYRHWAESAIGFSILLISLQFLKSVVADLQQHNDIMSFLGHLADHGLISILIYIFIGIVFTALIQSSSAAIALTLTMCINGWLPFDIGAAMVLGENVGTTITTEIASWAGNSASKKAARIHVLFNVIGVLWVLPFLPFILPFLAWMMKDWIGIGDPFTDTKAMPMGLSLFYTLFNLVNAVIFMVLLPELIRLASRTVKSKSDGQRKLFFIDTGSNTADLSLPIARQEILQQCQRVRHLNTILNRITNYSSEADFHNQIKLANDYLKTLNENQEAINEYLTGMVEDRSSLLTSKQIKSLLNISLLVDHLRTKYERVYQLLGDKRQQRIWFGPTQRSILLHRINDANVMLKSCIQMLQTNSINRNQWKGLTYDLSEKDQDYLDYERELMRELERGEMKLSSVVMYYRMSQYMDSINEALRNILSELVDEPLMHKTVNA